MKNNYNFILDTDSYKNDHERMLPLGTKKIFSTIVFRKPNKYTSMTKFMGITYAVRNYLNHTITLEEIAIAKKYVEFQGYEFNEDRWIKIVKNHKGKLPLSVKSIAEGMIVPVGIPVVTVENTDDDFAWLVSYIEPALQRIIWKMTTVASCAYETYTYLNKKMQEHSDNNEQVNFHLHNFGARGADSYESNIMASISHIAAGFNGTDSLNTDFEIYKLYNLPNNSEFKPRCFSVLASEHSVMCANSDANERDDELAIKMMLDLLEQELTKIESGKNGCPIVSIVSDTYDIYRVCSDLIGGCFKQRVIDLGKRGGKVVIRPDSGDPTQVPIKCLEILMDKFGFTINKKGFKQLPKYIKVLQGDGINRESIAKIIDNLESKKICLTELIFGEGGALTHGASRDEFSCSMKATALMDKGGKWIDLFKDPVTDIGKRSLKGVVSTFSNKYRPHVFAERHGLDKFNLDVEDIMFEVFRNGEIKNLPLNFEDVLKYN